MKKNLFSLFAKCYKLLKNPLIAIELIYNKIK